MSQRIHWRICRNGRGRVSEQPTKDNNIAGWRCYENRLDSDNNNDADARRNGISEAEATNSIQFKLQYYVDMDQSAGQRHKQQQQQTLYIATVNTQ